jgi:periplasmic divalent cation tolerance protein
MPPSPDAVVVLSTVATPDDGAALIRALLERRLIACGTMLAGARSLYHWEGGVADEGETVLMLKTRPSLVAAIESAFRELHPYKVPEMLALTPTAGLADYVGWIGDETAAGA